MFKAILILMGSGLLLVALIAGIICVGGFQGYGSGQHTGYITAVEEVGVIWKTKRIHVKTDLASSQEDVYCVIDQTIYDAAREAAKRKLPVTLSYKDQGIVMSWECEGESTTVVGIEGVE